MHAFYFPLHYQYWLIDCTAIVTTSWEASVLWCKILSYIASLLRYLHNLLIKFWNCKLIAVKVLNIAVRACFSPLETIPTPSNLWYNKKRCFHSCQEMLSRSETNNWLDLIQPRSLSILQKETKNGSGLFHLLLILDRCCYHGSFYESLSGILLLILELKFCKLSSVEGTILAKLNKIIIIFDISHTPYQAQCNWQLSTCTGLLTNTACKLSILQFSNCLWMFPLFWKLNKLHIIMHQQPSHNSLNHIVYPQVLGQIGVFTPCRRHG